MEAQLELTNSTPAVMPGMIPEPDAALDQNVATTVADDATNDVPAQEPVGDEVATTMPAVAESTDNAPAVAQAADAAIPAGSPEPSTPAEEHHADVTDTLIAANAEPPSECDMPVHPACALFPMMTDDRLDELVASIKTNGLLNKIVIHDGQIVDGRNRYVACRRASVKPTFIDWKKKRPGTMSLYDWIWSENGDRRHLTIDQITMIQVALYALAEQEAAHKRKADSGRAQGDRGREGGRGNKKPQPMNSSEGASPVSGSNDAPAQTSAVSPTPRVAKKHSGDTRATLAAKTGSSQHKVGQAMNAMEDPALAKEVAEGKKSLCEADKEVKARAGAAPAAPTGKGSKQKAEGNARKSSFSVADAVNKIIGQVDALLAKANGDDRKLFLKELKEMLKGRK
jgi:hypothetical protein